MLDQLKLRTKLLLIALMAIIPSFILLWLLISEKNIAIQFSYKEYIGNQYLRPLRQAQEGLALFVESVETDMAAADATGSWSLSEDSLKLSRKITEALAAFSAIDEEWNGAIKVGPRITTLRERWNREMESIGRRNPQIFRENMDSIRGDIRRLISFVGDDSNLILDPDLDSYYMMDATLLKIPALQDQMTEIAFRVRSILEQGEIAAEERALLLANIGTFAATMDELERNMRTGFQNNPAGTLQPALSPYVDEFRLASQRLQRFAVERLLSNNDFSQAAREDWKALLVDARRSGFRLWDNAIDELDALLLARVAGFQTNKVQAIVGVILILLLASLFVYYISQRLSQRVRRLAELSVLIASRPEDDGGQVAKGLVALVSKDEIGALAESTARMATQIRQFITEIRASQSRLEEYNATLEARVAERTKEIESKNAELEGALKMVRDAQNRLVTQEKLASLGSLTAGIAHEIKNPLNFVNNFAQLSADLADELKETIQGLGGKLTDAERDDLLEVIGMISQNVTKINEHGQRADGIVKGMLAHSRGKAGQRQLVDLNGMLSEYTKLAYHGLRADDSTFNVTLDMVFDAEVGKVPVIPQDLSRAILNIVNNGCYSAHQKKKQKGGDFEPMIRVTSKVIGDNVEIRIRDNGLGIPKEKLEKVFEPFYTTKPTGQGTGLGLSMTFDIIVQQHQGELRVESVEGEFAEFIIHLPRNPNQEAVEIEKGAGTP